MTRDQRRRLPKAKLFNVRWTGVSYCFAKFRLANAMMVKVGRVELMWRMPWLEHSARALHPEIF